MRVLLLAAAAVACTGLAPQVPFRSSAQRSAPRLLGLRMAVTEDEKLRNELDVWRMREESLRGFYTAIVNWKEDGREEELRRQEEDADAAAEATRSAFVASAAAVLVGAFVLRLGGRAALVSLLGLDLVADLGLDEQINSALEYANALGGWTVVGFFAAWIVAKVFLVDVVREPPPPTPSPTRRLGRSSSGRPSCQPSPPSPSATVAHCGPPHSRVAVRAQVSIALAFSSGVIFGGVIQGALVSCAGATLGSLCAFALSRTLLQEKVEQLVDKGLHPV